MIDGKFKAGHSYKLSRDRQPILCIKSARNSAVFETGDSFSVKNHNKFHLYDDCGVIGIRGWIYKLANRYL